MRKDYYTIEETFARTKSKVDHLFELSESDQAKIEYKFTVCQKFMQAKKKKGSRCLQQIVDDIQQELEGTSIGLNWAKANSNERKTMKPVEERDLQKSFSRKRQGGTPIVTSEKTTLGAVRRWLRTLRKGNYNPISLRDGRFRSGHGPKISQEICELLARHARFFQNENRPSASHLYKDLKNDVDTLNAERASRGEYALSYPSLTRFRADISKLDQFITYASRHTLDAARRKYRMIGNGLDDTITRALQRVEMDGWQVQLHVLLQKEPEWNELPEDLQEAIKAARVCVIAAIDYRSQCIVSLWPSLTENANAAMQSFRMIMQDKSKLACSVGAASLWHMNGKPELLVFDNGSAFIDTVFRRALADCRISYAVTVGGIPWLRSRIEGAFKKFARDFLQDFTGRTFSNVVDKGDYPAQARASVSLQNFLIAFFSYVVDGYHNMALEALGGYTPAEEWQRLVDLYGEPAESLDYDDSRAVFGATYIRTLSSSGIYFMGLYYNSTALQAWRRRHGDKKIEVRVDPQNLGRLSAHTDNEWIIVPTHRRFEGASIDGIKLMSREIQRRMKARQEAHKDILNDVRKRIQDISQAAREQSGIIHLAPTQEEIDRIEDGLTIGFTMGDVSPEDLDADDVLGAILERASLALPAPDVPAPSSVPEPQVRAPVRKTWISEGDDE